MTIEDIKYAYLSDQITLRSVIFLLKDEGKSPFEMSILIGKWENEKIKRDINNKK